MSGTIRGLGDLKKEDEGERGQTFYAGGQKSGIAIEGDSPSATAAARLFSQASPHPPSQQDPGAPGERTVVVSVTLWKDGFTVQREGQAEGSLRSYSDQAGREFLASLERREMPREFQREAAKSGVAFDFKLDDRHSRLHSEQQQALAKPSPQPVVPFAGAGHALGSQSAAAPVPVSPAVGSGAASVPVKLVLDDGKPITQVQVRLKDGRRVVGKFNHDHTIAHLRAFVDSQLGASATAPYTLVTAAPPPTPLTDLSVTLAAANLLNSAVIQR